MPRIRIGNQTAISCADPLEPFHFALQNGFDAFEWFADKKEHDDGSVAGWDEADMDADARHWIRDTGTAHNVLFTVHAPWQANPLHADGIPLLIRSIDFARDIGADLVNLHLYMDDGPQGYAQALEPVLRYAVAAKAARQHRKHAAHHAGRFQPDVRLPGRAAGTFSPATVGMCLDIGHANLCAPTHNNFIRYLDLLADDGADHSRSRARKQRRSPTAI